MMPARPHLVPVPSGAPEKSVARRRPPRPLWRERAGSVLRQRRLAAGLRLSDVARRAGLSTQYLSEVERGRKEASSEVLDAACGALGLELLDLVRAVGDGLADPGRSETGAPARPSGQALCLAA